VIGIKELILSIHDIREMVLDGLYSIFLNEKEILKQFYGY